MGHLERKSKTKSRNDKIRTVLLRTIKAAALLTIFAAAPNAIQGFQKLGLIPSRRQSETIKRSYLRLLKSGHLKYEGKYLRLTTKGERELHILEMDGYQLKKPKKWDHKWRVLIFDIPEHRRSMRDKVRRTVQEIGFVRLQDSVWVYPYDCEDLVTLLKADFRIGKDMLYMIVDQLEGDGWLKQEFKLP